MQSKLNIISNAIVLLGHAAITSISATTSENTELTNAALSAYDLLLPGVLSRNNWRFATTISDIYRFRKDFTVNVGPIDSVLTTTVTSANSNYSTVGAEAVASVIQYDVIPTTVPQIEDDVVYYIKGLTSNTFEVYLTRAAAVAGVGQISFTNAGTNAQFNSVQAQATGINLEEGQIVRVGLSTSDALPTVAPANTAITSGDNFYAVRESSDDNFRLYASKEDAYNQENVLTFDSTGSGVQKIFKYANNESNWKSIYPMPSNFLKLIRVWPQNYDYNTYSAYVGLSNAQKVFAPYFYSSGTENYLTIEYIQLVNSPDNTNSVSSQVFPDRFAEYFVYEIAVYLALSTAQRPDYYNVLEQKRVNAFAMAAASEAQNNPSHGLMSFPALNQRYISDIDGYN